MAGTAGLLLVAITAMAPARATAGSGPPTGAPCAPLDVALVLDTTTSMDPAIENVKAEMTEFTRAVEAASGGDYRMALVDFGRGVQVHSTFALRNAEAIRAQLPGLRQVRGNYGQPEAWDEALTTVIDTRTAAEANATAADSRGEQIGDFNTPWRADAKKMVVLVTDARPAGFDDHFEEADALRASGAAIRAAEQGIRVPTIFVPNGNQEDDAVTSLQRVAGYTGASYFATAEDGSNLSDGLDLVVETCASDSDGDGLFDTWETDGYDPDADGTIDVDLPAMGADPQHKDLFVQVNWMSPDGVTPCYFLVWCPGGADGDHPPEPEALRRVVEVFDRAPVDNPDGKPGITVHFDTGDPSLPSSIGGDGLRGGPLPGLHVEDLTKDPDLLTSIQKDRLGDQRAAVFTLAVYVHLITDDDEMGQAFTIPNDTLVIADALMTSTQLEAITMTHELGHTLGLRHGGVDNLHGKPNYLSIMNYDFALKGGLIRNGEVGLIDYSRYDLGAIDERSLDESVGIQPVAGSEPPTNLTAYMRCTDRESSVEAQLIELTVPVDWNCDGDTADAGFYGSVNLDTQQDILDDRNDWATLTFTGGARGGLQSGGEPLDEEGFDYEAWILAPKDHAISFRGPGSVSTPGEASQLRLRFLATNIGTRSDVYTVEASSMGDWKAHPRAPDEIELAAGETAVVPIDVETAAGVRDGDRVEVQVSLRSQAAPDVVSATETAVVIVGEGASPNLGPLEAPRRVETKSRFEISGSGFEPSETVLIASTPGWFEPTEVVATADGSITATLESPAEPSSTSIVAVGVGSPPEPDSAARSPEQTAPPTGLRAEIEAFAPKEPEAPTPGSGGVPLWVPIALTLAGAVAAGGWWWLRTHPRQPSGIPAERSDTPEEPSASES